MIELQGTLFLVDDLRSDAIAQLIVYPKLMSIIPRNPAVQAGPADVSQFWDRVSAHNWHGHYLVTEQRDAGALLMSDTTFLGAAIQVIMDCPAWCVFMPQSLMRENPKDLQELLSVAKECNSLHRVVSKFGKLLGALGMIENTKE